MDDANAIKLKRVIEQQHGGTSSFVKSVRVHQTNGNRADWDGVVYVFDLKGHPKAKRAFAWSSHIAGSPKDRFFAVLQNGAGDNSRAGGQSCIGGHPQMGRAGYEAVGHTRGRGFVRRAISTRGPVSPHTGENRMRLPALASHPLGSQNADDAIA